MSDIQSDLTLRLRQRFTLWAENLALSEGLSMALFDRLVAAYTEPHRKYHTLRHLESLYGEFEGVADFLSHPDSHATIEAAIWFHDVVYDPARLDNEAASARLAAVELAALGLSPAFIERVHIAIMATVHTKEPTHPDDRLFVDMDLASLGYPTKIFDDNAAAIREEFSIYPDNIFYAGNNAMFLRLLNRPRIYYTTYFYDKYETLARQNITRTLEARGIIV
jgi:predicted metal-dependent HD superfamily phosphohydrolase